MAILGIVLAPLSTSFASGMVQQASQTRREQAYANARVALQRVAARRPLRKRGDVRRAEHVRRLHVDADGVERQSPGGWCPAVIPAGAASSGVQWCTVRTRARRRDSTLSIPRHESHRLRRRHRLDVRDSYLAAQPAHGRRTRLPSGAPAAARRRAGSGISGRRRDVPERVPAHARGRFNVNVDPVNHPNEHYEMNDSITLRNAPRCA